MKKLKVYVPQDGPYGLEPEEGGELVEEETCYLKSDVDAVIAELKAENERLKAKLESVQASMYCDVVDANMENLKLKRALWLARSYRGRDNSILLPSKFMRNVWDNVERKCLKKAEQYK